MTIECYYDKCPRHNAFNNPNDNDGPFCYEFECLATEEEIEIYREHRILYLSNRAKETQQKAQSNNDEKRS